MSNYSNLVHEVSSNWATGNQGTPMGIRPPQPYLNFEGQIKYSTLPQPVPGKSYNLLKINSNREPFAIQHLANGYGDGVVKRLGTSIGT